VSLEIWAGIECTLNRVGENYFSQCDKNAHFRRQGDLKTFAELGIQRIRYPCLWEQVSPDTEGLYDWSILDQNLSELQSLGLKPIAGLLHHGSGPRFTDLLDPLFPEKFAKYAADFAARYPWIDEYILIDEALTTARFSGLYGHWYPHHQSDHSFSKALIHQIKASLLAMKAIRQIRPDAKFIQVDDLGRAQSTPPLNYQIHFENHRRWLSFDLICGLVGPEHILYQFLLESGITSEELTWLQVNKSEPDFIGINHYLLSNRFLDHRLEMYPPYFYGGNRNGPYVDIGAVDVKEVPFIEAEEIFKEAWYRYHIPLVITEVHIRGHREDQLRWFHEIWQTALSLRQQKIPIHAVTAWSLLGTFDWHRLCTVSENFYEPGVFDLRCLNDGLHPTALSQMITTLAAGKSYEHPILESPGWWRLERPPYFRKKFFPRNKPLVITGGAGTLGQAFAKICERRCIPYVLLNHAEMDIADIDSVARILDEIQPWAVINGAGYVKVDEAEIEIAKCFRINTEGPAILAKYTADSKIPLINFSSDLVFDGHREDPYVESLPPSPINAYGRSKAESEVRVLSHSPDALVVRTSSFFGPWDQFSFATHVLKEISQRREFSVASDIKISPTYIPDLVHACLDLLIDGERGLIHLTNSGGVSWAQFAKTIAHAANLRSFSVDASFIIEKTFQELNLRALRPKNSVLASEKLNLMPSFEDAVNRYFSELEVHI
jgi:dTDP-4-dehydrorhamnose reductase